MRRTCSVASVTAYVDRRPRSLDLGVSSRSGRRRPSFSVWAWVAPRRYDLGGRRCPVGLRLTLKIGWFQLWPRPACGWRSHVIRELDFQRRVLPTIRDKAIAS